MTMSIHEKPQETFCHQRKCSVMSEQYMIASFATINPTFTTLATSGTFVHSHYKSAQHTCTFQTYVRNHILCPIYVHTQVTRINLTQTIGFLCESLVTHYFSEHALLFRRCAIFHHFEFFDQTTPSCIFPTHFQTVTEHFL